MDLLLLIILNPTYFHKHKNSQYYKVIRLINKSFKNELFFRSVGITLSINLPSSFKELCTKSANLSWHTINFAFGSFLYYP